MDRTYCEPATMVLEMRCENGALTYEWGVVSRTIALKRDIRQCARPISGLWMAHRKENARFLCSTIRMH